MTRKKNVSWHIGEPDASGRWTWDQVKVSILLDIRDELQRLNALFHCSSVGKIPAHLAAIRRNTERKKRK